MADEMNGIERLRKFANDIALNVSGSSVKREIVMKRESCDYPDEELGQFVKSLADQVERERAVPEIERVILDNPATVIIWDDGGKTVVKRQAGDEWDAEKGVAMAICKRLYDNAGRYNDVIKRAIEMAECPSKTKGGRNGR